MQLSQDWPRHGDEGLCLPLRPALPTSKPSGLSCIILGPSSAGPASSSPPSRDHSSSVPIEICREKWDVGARPCRQAALSWEALHRRLSEPRCAPKAEGVGSSRDQEGKLPEHTTCQGLLSICKMSIRITAHRGEWRVNESAFGTLLVPCISSSQYFISTRACSLIIPSHLFAYASS